MQSGVFYEIRLELRNNCCSNELLVSSIPITQNADCANNNTCCETTLGGHYFNLVTATGLVDISENDLCGGTTVQFCTEIVYDATVCNSPIVPEECIIVTAEPRDYCNPSTLGNVQYLEQTTTGLWCGIFDLPEYTSPNACPDIRVMTYNTCCPDFPSNDVIEIPFAGSCNTSNP